MAGRAITPRDRISHPKAAEIDSRQRQIARFDDCRRLTGALISMSFRGSGYREGDISQPARGRFLQIMIILLLETCNSSGWRWPAHFRPELEGRQE
jgi:hypothetical protein